MRVQAWLRFLQSNNASEADKQQAAALKQDNIRFPPRQIPDSLEGLEIDHLGALAVRLTVIEVSRAVD